MGRLNCVVRIIVRGETFGRVAAGPATSIRDEEQVHYLVSYSFIDGWYSPNNECSQFFSLQKRGVTWFLQRKGEKHILFSCNDWQFPKIEIFICHLLSMKFLFLNAKCIEDKVVIIIKLQSNYLSWKCKEEWIFLLLVVFPRNFPCLQKTFRVQIYSWHLPLIPLFHDLNDGFGCPYCKMTEYSHLNHCSVCTCTMDRLPSHPIKNQCWNQQSTTKHTPKININENGMNNR